MHTDRVYEIWAVNIILDTGISDLISDLETDLLADITASD